MHKDDSQLIADYLGGDEESFEFLIDRYSGTIYSFIARLSGNAEVADELTQEAFLKAWKSIERFDLTHSFKTWIFSIARNTVIDWMRKKKLMYFSQLDAGKEISFEDSLVDGEPLQDELLEKKEMVAELENAVAGIAPHYKEIIFLHLTENLTFEEIAGIVSKPMNTVKSQYRRALALLRTYLTNVHQN